MNSFIRYLHPVLVTVEQLERIEQILNLPVDDVSELSQLVDDESTDYKDRMDEGLEE